MRRITGLVLVGLGVFLVSTAILARVYVLDQVRVTPIDQYAQTVGPGTGTYFDPPTLSEKQSDLVARRTLKGDVAASNETTGVWDVSVVVQTADGALVRATIDRVAFDRKSGESVHCCGEAVDAEPTPHEGMSYKFPFSTEKKTYQFWDVNSRRAFPAQYVSEEKIQGLTTYKFVQEIPTLELRKQEGAGSLVGEPPSFQPPVMYSNTRTAWVEPTTGIIVKGNEQARTTLRNSAGEDKVTVLQADLTFNEDTQKAQAKLARDGITKINLVKWVVPIVGLVLGLAFVVVGLLLRRSRPGQDTVGEHADIVGPTEETQQLPPPRRV